MPITISTPEALDTKIRLLPGRRGAIRCVQIEDRGDSQRQINRRPSRPAKERRAADAQLVRKLLKRWGGFVPATDVLQGGHDEKLLGKLRRLQSDSAPMR